MIVIAFEAGIVTFAISVEAFIHAKLALLLKLSRCHPYSTGFPLEAIILTTVIENLSQLSVLFRMSSDP